MPAALSDQNGSPAGIIGGHPDSRPTISKPLVPKGTLDRFKHIEVTPVIGREYSDLKVKDLLSWSDEQISDLALIISQRGVVFLRGQGDVTPEEMKQFMLRLTKTAGCPTSSGLHVHPLTAEGSELGDQISVISAAAQRVSGGLTRQQSDVSRFASAGWHSDMYVINEMRG